MDTFIAMFFALGFVGHGHAVHPAHHTATLAVEHIRSQPVRPVSERRLRILATNAWLRDLRHVPIRPAAIDTIDIALKAHQPRS